MLRGGTVEGQEGADPFLPLVANLDFDDGIDIANLEDSTMSDWLCNLTPNGITSGPEELLSVTELFGELGNGNAIDGMSGSGLIGAESDHELKSPEKFQDLRFTSTPKSKSTADSGIGEDTSLNKSIEYKVVLNDITDKLKADYFTSLTDVCEYSPSSTKKTQGNVHKTPVKRPMSADENRSLTVDSTPSGLERNVSIIRRRIRTLPSVLPSNLMSRAESFRTNFAVTPQASKRKIRSSKTANAIQPTAVVNCVKCSRPASQSEELEISESEIVYYTGIKKHKSALGIVKFLKIPDGGNLAPFKKIIATLMKLRFAFPYEDLGFRLRAATAEVKNFIRDVSSVMCQSLVDFLPWSEPPTAERTLKKSFYLREFTDEEMKVVILVEDKSQLPICYVSEPFDPSFDAIEIIMATCSNHFIDNDIVCAYVNDTPTFHRVQQMATGPVANLAEGRFNENAVQAFLVRMGEVMTELQSYQITDITKRKSETVIAFDAGVKICSAFVNVNHLADDNLLTYFQQIYARSSQACLNKM